MRNVRLSVLGANEERLGHLELDMDAMEREYQQSQRAKQPAMSENGVPGKITGDFEVFRDGTWQKVQFAPMRRVRRRRDK